MIRDGEYSVTYGLTATIPVPVLAGPESVVALPPPREIPETVRGLVRRHGRRR